MDYDWLVVGSGFGGSVSALRLREKGYSVGVVECGKRFSDADFPKSTWDLRRYFWAPRLGMRGIFRMSTFKHVAIVSGSGVGGGSLGYANTLYRARRRFYEDPQWSELADWETALAPHYDTAEQMLGVVAYDQDDPADDLLREFAREIGVEDTYAKTRVGVLLGGGAPGETIPDPFFGGAGPERTVCERCGRCMVGCPVGAKNTLVKNYLYLAEQAGADVFPERLVVDVKPLGAPDGSEGYEITTERPGAWLRRRRRTFTARGVVFAAGPLGTNKLLASCRLHGSLPRLSDRIGKLVRTNSEAILAVTLPPDAPDIQKRVAITGSMYPDPDTHIETVVYGDAADSMSSLYTVLVGDCTRVTRPLKLVGAALTHPVTFLKLLNPRGWSRRTIIVLVMQTLDNAIELRALHGRLPPRGQEHAREELPVVRGTGGRAGHARAHGDRHPAARRRRLRGHQRTLRLLAAQGAARADGARRRGRRGRAGHEPAARGVQAQRLAAEAERSAGRARAHELGGDPRRHAAARLAGGDPAGGDHRLDLPRPQHPHRDRRLRRRRRRRLGALHAADR